MHHIVMLKLMMLIAIRQPTAGDIDWSEFLWNYTHHIQARASKMLLKFLILKKISRF